MTPIRTLTIIAALGAASPALAEGDVAAGEKLFKKCKACHMIVNGDDVIFKGGKTGPNLYGIIGRAAASYEDFSYGKSIAAAGEAGLVWDEALLIEYVTDPKAFLKTYLDDGSAKSKMSFRLKKGGEDIAAYLASVSPAMEMEATEGEATETEAETEAEPSN
jgi:cytochrome c